MGFQTERGKMDALTIQLASLVVHLAEYIETEELTDLRSAHGLLANAEVVEALKPDVMLPLTRSGKSVIEILSERVGE